MSANIKQSVSCLTPLEIETLKATAFELIVQYKMPQEILLKITEEYCTSCQNRSYDKRVQENDDRLRQQWGLPLVDTLVEYHTPCVTKVRFCKR